MTPEQIAVFSVTNDFYMWGGVILGLMISGFFKHFLNVLTHRFERPIRIRFGNLNGRHERKDNFEYLYLYNGSYYTLEQRDFLHKQRLKKFKQIKSPLSFDSIFFVVVCFCLMVSLIYFISFELFNTDLGF